MKIISRPFRKARWSLVRFAKMVIFEDDISRFWHKNNQKHRIFAKKWPPKNQIYSKELSKKPKTIKVVKKIFNIFFIKKNLVTLQEGAKVKLMNKMYLWYWTEVEIFESLEEDPRSHCESYGEGKKYMSYTECFLKNRCAWGHWRLGSNILLAFNFLADFLQFVAEQERTLIAIWLLQIMDLCGLFSLSINGSDKICI